MRVYFFFLALLWSFNTLQAAHIVGGDFYYDCLGNNQYRITMKVYRDGVSAGAQYDQQAKIGVFTGAGAVFSQITLAPQNIGNIPPNNPDPCINTPPPTSVRVEQATYTTVLTLPYNPAGYYITYQRCCRNNTISNLNQPGAQGATYSLFISNLAQQTCNSSLRFTNFPPIFVCAGEPLVFDHSATDPNGDQILYEFCSPWTGFDQDDPGGDQSTRVPEPPPYTDVAFQAPYTALNPMGGNPQISINPTTGEITGIPTTVGQYVVGICAKEYRNGVLIAEIRRDFQFNVITCQRSITAGIQHDAVIGYQEYLLNSCGINTIQFINQTTAGANVIITGYLWTFDINGTPTTSTETNPSITFPGVGTYNGTLVVNPGSSSCTDTAKIRVNVFPEINAAFTFPITTCVGLPITFDDLSTSGATITNWTWHFGDGDISTQPEPTHIYTTANNFDVLLQVTDNNGCVDTAHHFLSYFPAPVIEIATNNSSGCIPLVVNFTNNSIPSNGYTFEWNLGDGTNITTLNPSHTYPLPGTYDIYIKATSPIGCVSERTFPAYIRASSKPTAAFSYDNNNCDVQPLVYTDNSVAGSNPITNWAWDFGDGQTSTIPSPTYQFSLAGTFPVQLTVSDEIGCSHTNTQNILWYPAPNLSIAPSAQIGCAPVEVSFVNNSSPINGYTINWNLGDGTTSTIASPTHTYTTPGIYDVRLTIRSPIGGCFSDRTYQDYITAFAPPDAAYSHPNICEVAPIPYTDLSIVGSAPLATWTWDFGDGQTDNTQNPAHQFTQAGQYIVKLTITDTNGCQDTTSKSVLWYPAAQLSATPSVYEGCVPVPVSFNNLSAPINGYAINWDFGDGATSTQVSPNHIYTIPGVYSVGLNITSPSGCISDTTYNSWITAGEVPVANFSYNPTDLSNFNSTATFTDESTGAFSWDWTFSDGTTFNYANPTHTFADTGKYEVTLLVAHLSGCTDSITKIVDVVPKFTYFLPNAFTPNSDGVNDGFKGAGIFFGFKNFEMVIFNRWGEKVFETNDPAEAWNGRKNNVGVVEKNGVYVGLVRLTGPRNEKQEYKIFVTLVR